MERKELNEKTVIFQILFFVGVGLIILGIIIKNLIIAAIGIVIFVLFAIIMRGAEGLLLLKKNR